MEQGLSKLIRVWLPTLILFYAFTASSLKAYRGYHETFGEGDYYLDLYFEVNPKGYFQKSLAATQIPFKGFFVHGDREEPVSGTFVRADGASNYRFETSEGAFEGRLIPSLGQCEPTLNFQIGRSNRTISSGVLRAGFCD